MAEIKQEILTLLTKVWVWLLLVLLGLIGKISVDMLQGRKMTGRQILSSIGIGLFVGVVTAALCVYKGWTQAGIVIIPIATSMSEKIMLALFSIDYTELRQILIELLTRRKQ